MPNRCSGMEAEANPVWLSGAVLTLLNKIVLPIIWFGGLAGVVLWVISTTGRISVTPGFRLIVAFALIASGLLAWLTAHLQRVGYCGRSLIVANYWREDRIPFEHVEAVEPVVVVSRSPCAHLLQPPDAVWLDRLLHAQVGTTPCYVQRTGRGVEERRLARGAVMSGYCTGVC